MNVGHSPQLQRQTTLLNVRVSVDSTPDGGALLIFGLSESGEQIIVPLDAKARKIVGTSLMAPGIVAANGNGDGH